MVAQQQMLEVISKQEWSSVYQIFNIQGRRRDTKHYSAVNHLLCFEPQWILGTDNLYHYGDCAIFSIYQNHVRYPSRISGQILNFSNIGIQEVLTSCTFVPVCRFLQLKNPSSGSVLCISCNFTHCNRSNDCARRTCIK